MCKVIMIGCDLHDATMVLKVADGPGATGAQGVCHVESAGDDRVG